jgi:mono/diheme cytochrome c family protein
MMGRGVRVLLFVAVGLGMSVGFVAGQGAQPPAQGRQNGAPRNGWNVPPTAAEEKNPLTVNDAVIAAGKKLYGNKCQRCHGAEGKGNGQDAEPKYQQDMNLTVAARAARNPDGVVFYKIWNGRTSPKMPRFSEELTKEQVWAIVTYVQTLRAKP